MDFLNRLDWSFKTGTLRGHMWSILYYLREREGVSGLAQSSGLLQNICGQSCSIHLEMRVYMEQLWSVLHYP